MNKYVEGLVESIERRAVTKSLTLELSGKQRMKDVIFFEDIVSIRSKNGALHTVRVEDDNAVCVGEQIFLFKNKEDVAVEIYKEKEKLHEDLDASINDGNDLKDSILVKSLVFMICFFLISLPFSMGCILIGSLSDSADKFMSDSSTGPTFFSVLLAFVSMITVFTFLFLLKKSLLDKKKEKKRIQKMVDDFRKDHSGKGVEVTQEANAIVR